MLDRPEKRNALSLEMWQAIPPLVAQAGADPAVKAIVVRGVDRTAFAAGADISQFHERFRNRDTALAYMNAVGGAAGALADCPKPAIALIHGDCVGGGVELAIACDLRFCSSGSRFGITPARLGICYSMASTRRVSQAIGPSKTKDLLFSGRLIDAETARAWGLADRVYAPGDLDRETAAFLDSVCRNSQYSIRFAKRALREIAAGAVEEPETLRDLRLGAKAGRRPGGRHRRLPGKTPAGVPMERVRRRLDTRFEPKAIHIVLPRMAAGRSVYQCHEQKLYRTALGTWLTLRVGRGSTNGCGSIRTEKPARQVGIRLARALQRGLHRCPPCNIYR